MEYDEAKDPQPAPFPVGTRVRYTGTAEFSYNGNPTIRYGDVGEVVAVHDPFYPAFDIDGQHGWSTVVIKGNQLAVDVDSLNRYERVG